MLRKRRNHNNLLYVVLLSLCVVSVILFFWNYWLSSRNTPEKVVEAFYTYEQEGNFAESWDLLHPLMKEKWSKTSFMTDRFHVFVGHFGTDTFDFSIGDAQIIENWKMTEEGEPIAEATKFTVIQTYKGKYGKFSFLQEVYVVLDEEEWKILWDYN